MTDRLRMTPRAAAQCAAVTRGNPERDRSGVMDWKQRALDNIMREHHEQIAALTAERDALRDALLGLTPSSRVPGCWCSGSHDVQDYGHQERCRKANAALQTGADHE